MSVGPEKAWRATARRSGWLAAMSAVIGVTLGLSAVALGDPINTVENPDYTGQLLKHPEGTVGFEFAEGGGRRIRFGAEGIPLTCDDGTSQPALPVPLDIRIRRNGRFTEENYHIDGSGTEEYFEVGGRLLGQGRAKGFVFLLFDPDDGPSVHYPDCSTLGRLRWTAERVP